MPMERLSVPVTIPMVLGRLSLMDMVIHGIVDHQKNSTDYERPTDYMKVVGF